MTIEAVPDIAATRSRLELLGSDAVARLDGREVQGLTLQGNPAQAERSLGGDGAGTLYVVAANTYLVTLKASTVVDLDELVRIGMGLDIGGMTRFAIARFKERTTPPPP